MLSNIVAVFIMIQAILINIPVMLTKMGAVLTKIALILVKSGAVLTKITPSFNRSRVGFSFLLTTDY